MHHGRILARPGSVNVSMWIKGLVDLGLRALCWWPTRTRELANVRVRYLKMPPGGSFKHGAKSSTQILNDAGD